MLHNWRYNRIELTAMPILTDRILDFISTSEEQTVRLGVRLGELLRRYDVLCFYGALGSGKTVLARGIARGWGAAVRATSPSFTLINEYPRLADGRILYHVDCYRLENPADVATVGLEDALDGEGAVMIEWPDHIVNWLPADHLQVDFTYVDQTRRALRWLAHGDRAGQLLKEFKLSAFGV